MKTCNCCNKVYNSIPNEAKLALDAILPGYYFNCSCGSTLVFPLNKITDKAVLADCKNSLQKLHIDLK
jgi:hypothetical protein